MDVPAASVMVVWDADRFGLAQLHQFRGRVGRGTRPSTCFLLTNAGPAALDRLGIMERSQDGFQIAEVDLEHRCGPHQNPPSPNMPDPGRHLSKQYNSSSGQIVLARGFRDDQQLPETAAAVSNPSQVLMEWIAACLPEKIPFKSIVHADMYLHRPASRSSITKSGWTLRVVRLPVLSPHTLQTLG